MPRARVTAPRSLEQVIASAKRHIQAGELSAAGALGRELLRLRPDWPRALHLLGVVAYKSGDFAAAVKLMRRAIDGDANNALYHGSLGVVYSVLGQVADATRELEKAIDLNPREPLYYFRLSEVRTFAIGDPYLAAMEELAGTMAALSLTSQGRLHFALAKADHHLGRFDAAFRHMTQGNVLKRSHVAYDEPQELRLFDRIRAVFERSLIEAKAGAGYRSPLPVFVVGMPRSGTTLVEQILASHPSVHGAGELPDFGREVAKLPPCPEGMPFLENVRQLSPGALLGLGKAYVLGLRRRSRSAARIVDKDIYQFHYLGLISLALPEARIIHVTRNPLDTCFSCYATTFQDGQYFTYDLAELGRYYRGYARLMAHWRDVLHADRFLEVSYESIVADLETEARRLVAFCGLAWDPRCLAFHETQRPVLTASVAQVRQPIYQTSLGRWQSYREHLGPLIAALGDLA
jgi:tetratricopeptide (TPR) repeat protein